MTINQPKYVDLHVHSSFSDGRFSPAELIALAALTGLSAIAIADHDTVSGIPEAISAAAKTGIELLTAVELSVQFGVFKDVHLLAYGIDYKDQRLNKQLKAFRDQREKRCHKIIGLVNERLAEAGYAPINYNDLTVYARDAVGRPHIAMAMIDRGYVVSVEDAFRRYLVPCNIPKQYWSIEDAIIEIKRVGGVPVLAHPTSISKSHSDLRMLIPKLADIGVEGVEVFNNMAYPEEMYLLQRLADIHGLLITAGSDFHGVGEGAEIGRGRDGIRFGMKLFDELKEKIRYNARL